MKHKMSGIGMSVEAAMDVREQQENCEKTREIVDRHHREAGSQGVAATRSHHSPDPLRAFLLHAGDKTRASDTWTRGHIVYLDKES